MQQNKITKNISELSSIISNTEKLTSSLADVIDKFNLKKHLSMFDMLKSKGLAASSLMNILIFLPFYGVASIYALYKSGVKTKEFQGEKDAYYNIKNNENINWRMLLMLHVKRFTYLVNHNINLQNTGTTAIIFDDTLLEKTGKKIEKASMVNDHVSGRFILGFKLLVCGFWDGSSFIPLDFSIHREKGRKQEKLSDAYKKAKKQTDNAQAMVDKTFKAKSQKEVVLIKLKQLFEENPNKTNKANLNRIELSYNTAKQSYIENCKTFAISQKALALSRQNIKRYYANERLFGLTAKERKEQHKKIVSHDSFGNIRRRETDIDKINSMLQMLGRVVKNGFTPNYVLTDSWFFCYALLFKLKSIKKGNIKLVSMVKINNQIFTDTKGRKMSVKNIPELYQKQITECRKLKSKYIKIACFYKDIRVNLFYVKMGKSSTWHLLLTTDLDLNFIKLMEVYQIRWSIEVFFKESKQYLNLGDCKSSNFDAQIADITISMIQHVLLSYFKRINYMQSFGELFKDINHELVELDLVSRLLEIFWELIQIICSIAGVDYILFQEDILNNEELLSKFVSIVPEKCLKNVA